VSFVDSSGLGSVVAALKQVRSSKGDLRLAAPNQQVRVVLELTTLEPCVPLLRHGRGSPELISEDLAPARSFEFRATLTHLEDGLDTLHRSVELRSRAHRPRRGRPLANGVRAALAEIGSNVLRLRTPPGAKEPKVESELRLESDTLPHC